MTTELDVSTPDGRILHAYDTGPDAASGLTLVWHHGSPQTGAPLEPVLAATLERGIRLVSYGRPSYGGSTPNPGRDVASAAGDVAAVTDALGIDSFAVMGASGGGPHALACAALLTDRVRGVVTIAGIAPYTERFDWFAGMVAPGGLRSALDGGRDGRVAFAAIDEFDPEQFIAADFAALDGEWSSLGADVGRSAQWGDDGLIDDDVAFASPWGFDLEQVSAPVLLVQGDLDRVVPRLHGAWMLSRLPNAQLWARPDDGHVSVLSVIPDALDRLAVLIDADRTTDRPADRPADAG
ncbi:alpha/beta fold hydrolase [Leifsonia sp. Leaf264]|uniref:alpha/beta fold hydrolase n=1 Tax=Leifsonia sp. Leaf264 TaxID=1736314 RepID=UPI0006F96B90|nr:alpha/beta hydrolase [Leifsonia sp. Leaf264]KQO97019.1 alpha/beta hydrolase [Leifsonia sp. Leaf264]